MRLATFAPFLLLAGCSSLIPTPAAKTKTDGGSTSEPTAFTASGSLSGSVTGTITGVVGSAYANEPGEDPFVVSFAATSEATVTSPAPSTISGFSVGCTLGFAAAPTVGTAYTTANYGGTKFDCLIEYTPQGATKTTQFGAGTNVTSSNDSLTFTATSVDDVSTSGGVDFYTLHGSINAVYVAADGSGSTVTMDLTF